MIKKIIFCHVFFLSSIFINGSMNHRPIIITDAQDLNLVAQARKRYRENSNGQEKKKKTEVTVKTKVSAADSNKEIKNRA